MINAFERFEQQGIKIDQERALTYSKLSCPFGCTYCFVDEMNQEQSKGAVYLDSQQLELLKNLPEQVKLIMLGCDTEFFQNKKEALEILEKLSELGKDISVITKIPLSDEYISSLVEIHNKIKNNGNIFSFSISITCISEPTLTKYEPGLPSPEKRIETLSSVYAKGIPATVAIRPLLPDISNEEIRNIVNRTKDHCFGYYSGPLYLKQERMKLLLLEHEPKAKKEHQPHWMLDGNQYHVLEKDGQMEFLASVVKELGKEFFDGGADVVEYLSNKN